MLRVVWRSPDNDDYVSLSAASQCHKNSFLKQPPVSGSLVTIFSSNTRVMPSNGFCEWLVVVSGTAVADASGREQRGRRGLYTSDEGGSGQGE